MKNPGKIAIICNYRLLPERVGGMDYFFWLFDKKCRENAIHADWFFPNQATHGGYGQMTIFATGASPETFFIAHALKNPQEYVTVMTHFTELCTKSIKSIKKITNAEIISVDHNPRPLGGYPLKKKLEKKVKGFLYGKYTDLFIAVSEAAKKDLVTDFGNFIKPRCTVIFNGIDPEKFRKKIHFGGTTKFIVASHLREAKGIQDVIAAVSDIGKKETIHFTVDIYGTGPFEGHLKMLVRNSALENVIHFKGSVSNLHDLYADYDYLIHPSHAETFCYTVVESLMSQLPVITTGNEGNVLGFVNEGENGFLYAAGNTAALEKILSDITHHEIAITGFHRSKAMMESVTLDAMVENYFKLLS